MPTSRSPAARSLADDLRARSDAELVALLTARPDLASPLPLDVSSLAARAATRASTQRALDGLDTLHLQVVDALAALPEPTTRTAVARVVAAPATRTGAVIGRLRELALVWGTDRSLRLVRAARDVVGPHPAGLGPALADALDRRSPARLADLASDLGLAPSGDPELTVAAIAAHLGDAAVLDRLLADAPPGARTVLERLTWGPPVGAVAQADREVRGADAGSPVGWLLAHGLLAVHDAGHVVLPLEVGLHLRGGRVRPAGEDVPPGLAPTAHPPRLVDAAAGGSAAELLRLVEELGTAWGQAPPPVLRAGGLGVRELRRTAHRLEVDEDVAAVVIEVAYAAGLVADDGEADPAWTPTPTYDDWTDLTPGARWAVLAGAWLSTTRVPGLVGSRDDRGAVRSALHTDLDRPAARTVRRAVLRELGALPAGEAPETGALQARLRWQAPRRCGALHDRLVTWTLREAELLGVTGRGALTGAARLLLGREPARGETVATNGSAALAEVARTDAAAVAMADLLPCPVDHVLLQADLTAVAPGPLEPRLAAVMAVSADVESRGGATVYRFTPASVRRALDAGWGAPELLDELAGASRTPVPQPLTYLVQDVARRHGQVRVGSASSYVRSDDEAALRELLADKRSAALRLRRIAPTVLVAQADPATVLAVLREAGLAPAAESPDGDVLVRRTTARRTGPRRPPRPVVVDPVVPPAGVLEAVVAGLRRGDEDAAERRREVAARPGPALGPTDPTLTLAALREAAAGRQKVWIGYADGSGRPVRRVVEPLTVEGGRVTAYDHGVDEVRTFSIHRVTGVAPVDEPA